nr:hypothetical protein [Pseudomonas viciae]
MTRLRAQRETLIIGQPGRLALEFTRDAPDAVKAVLSALADVAQIVGVSRQNMHKLMLAYPSSFPTPAHEGSISIWHLADVLSWLQARGNYSLTKDVLDVAQVALQVNVAKEGRRLPNQAFKELEALVG